MCLELHATDRTAPLASPALADLAPVVAAELVPALVPALELVDADAGPVERNPARVYLARLVSEAGRRTMGVALNAMAHLMVPGLPPCVARKGPRHAGDVACPHGLAFPWARMTYAHTAALRAALAGRYAPANVNKHLAALRGVLREAWRLGVMDAETYRRAVDLAPVRGEAIPAGRDVTGGELRALFEVCAADGTPASGARDAALLALLVGVGLRRAEAVALELADYQRDTGALVVRRGKGGKARIVYVTNGARAAVDAWLEVRGAEVGALLVPVNKAGRFDVRPMTAQAAYAALQRRAAEAGVATFTPHDCRRTFVGALLDAGADLAAVQRLAGHASPTTTSRYDRRGERAKQKAAELLHVPFKSSVRVG